MIADADDLAIAALEAQLWDAADRPPEMAYETRVFSVFVPPQARFQTAQLPCTYCDGPTYVTAEIPPHFRYAGRGRVLDETHWHAIRCPVCCRAIAVQVRVETRTYRRAYRVEIRSYGRIR